MPSPHDPNEDLRKEVGRTNALLIALLIWIITIGYILSRLE